MTTSARDELSSELFDVVDVIAGQRWTDEEIPQLLLRLSAAMVDEVEALAALPPILPDSGRQAVAVDVGGDDVEPELVGDGERLVHQRPDAVAARHCGGGLRRGRPARASRNTGVWRCRLAVDGRAA